MVIYDSRLELASKKRQLSARHRGIQEPCLFFPIQVIIRDSNMFSLFSELGKNKHQHSCKISGVFVVRVTSFLAPGVRATLQGLHKPTQGEPVKPPEI